VEENKMTNKTLHRLVALVLGAALLTLLGCATGTSKPSTFYLLKALPESETAVIEEGGVSVEVGPITVPAYLDRIQIATTADDHRLYVDQFHRWAEPLKDSFGRVIAENLSILLNTANVYILPQRRDVSADYQVELAVSRFSSDAHGTAVLVAYWTIIDNDARMVVVRKRSSITEHAASKDPEAVVAAQNMVLETLSRKIAAAIENLV
jgi:uncharacterized lipoprotein YmbA